MNYSYVWFNSYSRNERMCQHTSL